MNTSSIAHATSARWFRREIAVLGVLLVSGTLALGLVSRATSTAVPATVPAANFSAAYNRYAAHKQAQAEQVMDAALALPSVPASRWERYMGFKDAQAEQHDMTIVPAPPSPTGRERFATMKELQAEMREAAIR